MYPKIPFLSTRQRQRPRLRRNNTVVTRLTAGFQRFQRQWFCPDHNLYSELRQGQHPLAMVIACSDSRVDPLLLTDSRPGDLFVVRNVANIVPPYAPDTSHHGVSAALEYGVRYLRVRDLIVMGHAGCGGIKSLLDEKNIIQDEFLSVWMQVLHEARDKVNQLLPSASAADRYRACEMWGIRISLQNLRSFPWIQEQEELGNLTLHGWYFDLDSGELLHWDETRQDFLPLVNSCRTI